MPVFFPRFLGPLPLEVVVRETHESRLTITKNPVEAGADVADHAYVEPKRLTIEAVMSGGDFNPARLAASFQGLKLLQEQLEPFDIVTGLDLYRSMLIESIEVERNYTNSRVLWFTAECSEVILVDTESTPGEADNAEAGGSNAQQSRGKASNKQSNLTKGKLQAGPARERGSPTVQRGNTAVKPVATTGNTPEAARGGSMVEKFFGM